MNSIPDPSKLLNQLQVLTAAGRYALLRRASNQRIIADVKR